VLWDPATATELGEPLIGNHGPLYRIAFSPDGRTLAAGAKDGTVLVWKNILWSNFNSLEQQVCNLVRGDPSPAKLNELASGLHYSPICTT
jgi:WD40 repeat protein